jgi:hypothetical protein
VSWASSPASPQMPGEQPHRPALKPWVLAEQSVVASQATRIQRVGDMRTIWRAIGWIVLFWVILVAAFFLFFARHGALFPHSGNP